MQHDEVAIRRFGRDVLECEPVGGRIDEFGVGKERGRLREPGRVPEGLDLAARLIARACSAVETVERRGLQKKRPHHAELSPISTRDRSVAAALPVHVPAQKAQNEESKRQ
jgi:hypothetical protein